MRRAHIKGALVGVESVTPEGLKDVYKDFNASGEALVERLQAVPRARRARARLVHLRAAERSPETFDACLSVAERADVTFAQFVMLTPFPGHARLRRVGEVAWAPQPRDASTASR